MSRTRAAQRIPSSRSTACEDALKLYIRADAEGSACIFSRGEGGPGMDYQTMELAAICEALLAHGVDEILVKSAHAIASGIPT